MKLACHDVGKGVLQMPCNSTTHFIRSAMTSEYRDFLELPYAEIEALNLKAKEQRRKRVAPEIGRASCRERV